MHGGAATKDPETAQRYAEPVGGSTTTCRGPNHVTDPLVDHRRHGVSVIREESDTASAWPGVLLSPSRVARGEDGRSTVAFPSAPTPGPRGAAGAGRLLQPSLTVGPVDDPLEREADRAASLVTRPWAGLPSLSAAPSKAACSCAACRATAAPSAATPEVSGSTTAPAVVTGALDRPGRPLDTETRSFFEPRFGVSLDQVRAHDDAEARASARSLGAPAYTVGNDIVFGGPVQPSSVEGRRLLAHEISHTIQQAGGAGVRVQRQIGSLNTQQDDEKDPTCPPETPYRWGPTTGPGGAEPAVVSPCMAVPMPHSRQHPLQPEEHPVVTPPVEQPTPPPPPPPPPPPTRETPPKDQGTPTPKAPAKQQTTAPDEPKGYQFEDDPLSATGFGPNDTPIRVRPGPVRTTIIKQRGIGWDCSDEPKEFAIYGLNDRIDVERFGPELRTIFTRCPDAEVFVDGVPIPLQADAQIEAIRRATEVEERLIDATGGPDWAGHFGVGVMLGQPGEIHLEIDRGGRPVPHGEHISGLSTLETPGINAGARRAAIDQWSAQSGLAGVAHVYTSPRGSAPLTEWLSQSQVALTRQYHGKDQSGWEHQNFLQAQYSLTTGQWTVGIGSQLSYVFALPANLQLSFWGQLMEGANLTVGGTQTQLAAGSQFVWQPREWLGIGGQAGLGPTIQSSGPSTIDFSGLIFIQIQK
jgi:hypothetical protein